MGYVWSPLAPSASAVAKYTETLIAGDPALADLTFVADRPEQRAGRAAVPPAEARFDRGRALLELGDDHALGFVFERARAGNAIVELHDLSLHGLLARTTLGRKNFPRYLDRLQEAEGEWGRRMAYQRARGEFDPNLEIYMRANRTVCERARAVIVHSEWAKFQIELQGVETPVHVLPRYALTPDESAATARNRDEARARLGLPAERFLVAAFGPVAPTDRIDWVAEAVETLAGQGADIGLLVAGSCDEPGLVARLGASPQAARIALTGPLSRAQRDDAMLAADMVAVIGFPSAGGSPAIAAQALGFGRVLAVPDYAACSDLPDTVCEKIQLDEPAVPQLVAAIDRYLGAADRRAAMEERARAFAARELALDRARARLRAILERYWG